MKTCSLFFALLGLFALQPANAQCNINPFLIHSFEFNGANYQIVLENRNWQDAAACAASRGGKLAEINSQEEQDAIFLAITNAPINSANTVAMDGGGASYIWLGGHDSASEGNWIWNGDNDAISSPFWIGTSSGSAVNGSYENWGNEPDNWNNQDGLGLAITDWMFGQAGQWNDVFITNELYFIIEYPSVSLGTSDYSSSTFTVSPNPASGQVTISMPENEGEILLTDLSGKVVLTKACDPGITVLDVSALSPGTYLVQAGKEVKKLLVE